MLRFYVSPSQLDARITSASANWLTNRDGYLDQLRPLGQWDSAHGGGRWSDIKRVYMSLQSRKCGFCERKLSDERYEWDVEHFRPKDGVSDLPNPVEDADGAVLSTGGGAADVYWWLAFEPFNYLASCKPCNSRYKGNLFPIAGVRGQSEQTPQDLRLIEQPYLLYPIGAVDVPPESILTYRGAFAVPATNEPEARARAQITIEVLALNRREDLIEDRQTAIANLWGYLRDLQAGDEATARYQEGLRGVRRLTQKSAPHARCLRAFTGLFFDEPATAARLAAEATDALMPSDSGDDFIDGLIAGRG